MISRHLVVTTIVLPFVLFDVSNVTSRARLCYPIVVLCSLVTGPPPPPPPSFH